MGRYVQADMLCKNNEKKLARSVIHVIIIEYMSGHHLKRAEQRPMTSP